MYFFVSGVSMGLLAGVCFGLNFVPVAYVQDNYPNASRDCTLNFPLLYELISKFH